MKLWGGRFQGSTDPSVDRFNASIGFDQRLYRYDIAGSIAHCRMLARQGIIGADEADRIVAGLEAIRAEMDAGRFVFSLAHEDIHLNIEAALRERIGEVAGKLHTARSRNDQVALDVRLYLRDAIAQIVSRLLDLQEVLLDLATREASTIAPGYTHLQRAQPILLAHHLHAYVEMFGRDVERLQACYQRLDLSPLGAGALAGVPYPIDREFVAASLGFRGVTTNSLDAVGDRDFAVEFLAAAAIAGAHVSRLAEEVVLWTSAEFGFAELDDAYATGSSIMPQKKNPDVAELARAKTGRLFGHLVAMLTLLKGLPLAYNKDLQEDKEALFDATDTLLLTLPVFGGMLAAMRFHPERLRRAASESFALATDVADYLARRGVPFREAHEIVGRLVRSCIEGGRTLEDLTLADYRQFSPQFDADVLQITLESAVAARDIPGGTAPARVAAALAASRERMAAARAWAASLTPEI